MTLQNGSINQRLYALILRSDIMKKKAVSLLLTLALVFALAIPALAVDESQQYLFELRPADGGGGASVKVGDEFTLEFYLTRLDLDENEMYTLYAMQNEVQYNTEYLDLVGVELIEDFGGSRVNYINRSDGVHRRILINSGSNGMGEYAAHMLVAKMTFKALRDGEPAVTNESAAVATPTGSDHYMSVAKNVTVTIGDGENAEPETYTITIYSPTGGTITASPSGPAQAGAVINLGISLQSGYSVSLWSVTGADGSDVHKAGTVNTSFTMPEQNVTVTVQLNYTAPGAGGGGLGGGATTAPEREIAIDDDETPLAAPDTPRFDDVGTDYWAYIFIEYLAKLGFVNGKTDALYYPEDTITRGEFITILARMSGENMPGYGGEFSDVAGPDFYSGAVSWGYASGIVQGTSATTFSPDEKVLRQDIAVMTARYAAYKGYGFGTVNEPVEFTDAGKTADYAAEAVNSMQQANIISGYGDGSFNPTGNATRAEAAKILALVHHAMYPDLLADHYG